MWVTAADLCAGVSWFFSWMAPLCAQLLPRMVDVEDMCSREPPPIPTIDLKQMALDGELYRLPNTVLDWLWANWLNMNWNTYCECIPTTGPGPCADVPYFGSSVTGSLNGGRLLGGEQGVPHGWTTMVRTTNLTAASIGGQFFIGHELYDASHTLIGPAWTAGRTVNTLNNPQTTTYNAQYTTAEKSAARFVRVWSTPGGSSPQTPSGVYTYTAQVRLTFTGTCQDITIIPVPPAPLPEPLPPDMPPMPNPSVGCDLDDICAQLYSLRLELGHVDQLVTLLQRYGLPFGYVLGPVHAGLTGGGSIAVSGLVGIRVDITSAYPGRSLEGTPQYIWDLGWMSIGTVSGMLVEKRITRDPEVWQPDRMQEATSVGYFLKAGVTATITELQPEPY